MKDLVCIVVAALTCVAAASSVELKDRSILIDGKKTRILAGTMHYFQVPRSCWRDRMEKGKPLGRYWNIGPGDALYAPASMLKKGENRLVVFETEKPSAPRVEFGAVRNW